MTTASAPQLRLSKRLSRVTASPTIALIARTTQMRAQGISVISFGQGEPDFPTPAPIKAAAIDAINTNKTRYTPAGGIVELRRAIGQRLERDTGIAFSTDQIAVSVGGKEALFLAFQALCDEGDEVIIPAPYWVSYVDQVHLTGATPIVIETDDSTEFKLTPQQLEAAITPRTRIIMLNSPSNPTGSVYSEDELRALADVIERTEALVFSDEIYDAICYVPFKHWLRIVPQLAERTLIFNGASKTYAMTGWRMGYVAGPKPVLEAIRNMQSHSTTHTSSITQYAALAAFTPSEEIDAIVAEMVAAFHERRDVLIEGLRSIPGVTCTVPEGAFYAFPNVKSLLNRPLADGTVCANSQELSMYLLEKAHVAVVPGEAFGTPGYLRLSYAQSKEDIQEGLRRIAAAV